MAVSSATSWADTTEVSACASGCRLEAVKIRLNQSSAASSFLQLWNVANPTPGSTAPRIQIEIPAASVIGQVREWNINFGGQPFPTALTWFVSTASAGGTGATTSAPQLVEVYFGVGG